MESENQQAWNLVSEVELVYRSKVKASCRPEIKSVQAAYEFILSHWDQNQIELQEKSVAILMNTAKRVMGLYWMSTGGLTSTVVDPRLLFTAALKANATSIILAHNHPSGGLTPSEQDKTLTLKLAAAGKLLDIKLLDHLIVTKEGFYSFADEGLIA